MPVREYFERGLSIPLADVERVSRHYGCSIEDAQVLLIQFTPDQILPQRGYGLSLPARREIIGTTIDEFAAGLAEMENSLPLGGKADIILCTQVMPTATDLELMDINMLLGGFHYSKPKATLVEGIPTVRFRLRKGSPIWTALISMIPFLVIGGVLTFGIFRIEKIAHAIIPVILIGGGVLITLAAILRKPAIAYAERGGKLPYMPSTVPIAEAKPRVLSPQVEKKRKPTRADVRVELWEERDRLHIGIQDRETGDYYASWWDDDARQMFEYGFFKPGKDLDESVLSYAEEMGILAAPGKGFSSSNLPSAVTSITECATEDEARLRGRQKMAEGWKFRGAGTRKGRFKFEVSRGPGNVTRFVAPAKPHAEFHPQTEPEPNLKPLLVKWRAKGVEAGQKEGWMRVDETLLETMERHGDIIKDPHDLVWTDIDSWEETDHFFILYGSKMWRDASAVAGGNTDLAIDYYSDLRSAFWEGYLQGRINIGIDVYRQAQDIFTTVKSGNGRREATGLMHPQTKREISFPLRDEALSKLGDYEVVQVHDDGDVTVKVKDEIYVVTTDGRTFKEESLKFRPDEIVRYKDEKVRVLDHIGDRVNIFIPSRQEEVWVKPAKLERIDESRKQNMLPQTKPPAVTEAEWERAKFMWDLAKEDAEEGHPAVLYVWQGLNRYYPGDRDKQTSAIGFLDEAYEQYGRAIPAGEAAKLAQKWGVTDLLLTELGARGLGFAAHTKPRQKATGPLAATYGVGGRPAGATSVLLVDNMPVESLPEQLKVIPIIPGPAAEDRVNLEYMADSPEFLAQTMDMTGWREKLEKEFQTAIARTHGK